LKEQLGHPASPTHQEQASDNNQEICWGCVTSIPPFHIQLNKQAGVKRSWPGHTVVTVLLRGDVGGLRRALAILQGW